MMETNLLKTGIKIKIIPKLSNINIFIIEKMKKKERTFFAMLQLKEKNKKIY